MISKDFPRIRRFQKSTRQWLRWQTIFIHMGVGGDAVEKLLKELPVGLTNKELWELNRKASLKKKL